jgi:hypothetical protein
MLEFATGAVMRTSEPTAFSHLLEDYCRSVGMGDVEIDSQGGFFEIDDVVVMVRHDEDFGRLSLTAEVDSVDKEMIAFLAPLLLELNDALASAGGMAFSVNMEGGEIGLQSGAPLDGFRSDQLDVAFAELASKCRSARRLIRKVIEGVSNVENAILTGEDRAEHAQSFLIRG